MNPTIRWAITLVEWDKSTGAIVNVKWKVEVSDGERIVETPGASRFSPNPSDSNFIPLDDITEETVIEWVKKTTPNYLRTEKRALDRFNKANETSSDSGRGLPWAGVEIPRVVPKTY